MSLSLCVLLTPISFSLFLFSFLISFIAAFEGSGPARAAEITVLTSEVSCLLRGLTLTASDPNWTQLIRLLCDRRWILDFGFGLRFGCVSGGCVGCQRLRYAWRTGVPRYWSAWVLNGWPDSAYWKEINFKSTMWNVNEFFLYHLISNWVMLYILHVYLIYLLDYYIIIKMMRQ